MRSPQPRLSIHIRPKLVYDVSIRFSYFIASKRLPHFVSFPALVGTRGTHADPPGTVAAVSVSAETDGRLFAVRYRSMSCFPRVRLAGVPIRKCPSAPSRSISDFSMWGHGPRLDGLANRMYAVRWNW